MDLINHVFLNLWENAGIKDSIYSIEQFFIFEG